MLGREICTPNQLLFPLPRIVGDGDHDNYVAQIRDKIDEIYHLARQNLNNSAVNQKKS